MKNNVFGKVIEYLNSKGVDYKLTNEFCKQDIEFNYNGIAYKIYYMYEEVIVETKCTYTQNGVEDEFGEVLRLNYIQFDGMQFGEQELIINYLNIMFA